MSVLTDEQRPIVRTLSCPECGVTRGEECLTVQGKPVLEHARRIRRACNAGLILVGAR